MSGFGKNIIKEDIVVRFATQKERKPGESVRQNFYPTKGQTEDESVFVQKKSCVYEKTTYIFNKSTKTSIKKTKKKRYLPVLSHIVLFLCPLDQDIVVFLLVSYRTISVPTLS